MLVTSIFSFSYNVFHPSHTKFQFFIYIYFSVANVFNLDQSKILLFDKEVKKVCLNWWSNLQPPGHESDRLATELPGWTLPIWKSAISSSVQEWILQAHCWYFNDLPGKNLFVSNLLYNEASTTKLFFFAPKCSFVLSIDWRKYVRSKYKYLPLWIIIQNVLVHCSELQIRWMLGLAPSYKKTYFFPIGMIIVDAEIQINSVIWRLDEDNAFY